MKKNENKWIVIAIILAVMVIIGNILNVGASAKEVEVEEPVVVEETVEKEEKVCMTWYTLDEDETLGEGLANVLVYLNKTHDEGVELEEISELDLENDFCKVTCSAGDHNAVVIIRR